MNPEVSSDMNIDVPQKDLDEGRVLPALAWTIEKGLDVLPIIQIHSSEENPVMPIWPFRTVTTDFGLMIGIPAPSQC